MAKIQAMVSTFSYQEPAREASHCMTIGCLVFTVAPQASCPMVALMAFLTWASLGPTSAWSEANHQLTLSRIDFSPPRPIHRLDPFSWDFLSCVTLLLEPHVYTKQWIIKSFATIYNYIFPCDARRRLRLCSAVWHCHYGSLDYISVSCPLDVKLKKINSF